MLYFVLFQQCVALQFLCENSITLAIGSLPQRFASWLFMVMVLRRDMFSLLK